VSGVDNQRSLNIAGGITRDSARAGFSLNDLGKKEKSYDFFGETVPPKKFSAFTGGKRFL